MQSFSTKISYTRWHTCMKVANILNWKPKCYTTTPHVDLQDWGGPEAYIMQCILIAVISPSRGTRQLGRSDAEVE